MAVTLTPDPALGTNYGIHSHTAHNTRMFHGYINCSGNSYAAGGITCTIPIKTIWYVRLEPRIVTASVLFFTYDRTNTKLQVWQPVGPSATSGILIGGEVATTTSLGALTAIYVFAIGRDD